MYPDPKYATEVSVAKNNEVVRLAFIEPFPGRPIVEHTVVCISHELARALVIKISQVLDSDVTGMPGSQENPINHHNLILSPK